MTHLVARTFRGPEGTPPPGWELPVHGGAIWVGIYDDADTQIATTRAQTGTLGGNAFAAALTAAAGSLGYAATSGIRTTAVGECEFDVQPTMYLVQDEAYDPLMPADFAARLRELGRTARKR